MSRKLKKLQFRSPNHYSFVHDTITTVSLICNNQSNFLWLIADQSNDYTHRDFAPDTSYEPGSYNEVISIDMWNGKPCFFTKYTVNSIDDEPYWDEQTYPDRYVLEDELININNTIYNKWEKYESDSAGEYAPLAPSAVGGRVEVLTPVSLNIVNNLFAVQVESARCDGEGVDISTNYAKPSDLSPVARYNQVRYLSERPSLYEYDFIFYQGVMDEPQEYSKQLIVRAYSARDFNSSSTYHANTFYDSGYYNPLFGLWGIYGSTAAEEPGSLISDLTRTAHLSEASVSNSQLVISFYNKYSKTGSVANPAETLAFDWVKINKIRTVINW